MLSLLPYQAQCQYSILGRFISSTLRQNYVSPVIENSFHQCFCSPAETNGTFFWPFIPYWEWPVGSSSTTTSCPLCPLQPLPPPCLSSPRLVFNLCHALLRLPSTFFVTLCSSLCTFLNHLSDIAQNIHPHSYIFVMSCLHQRYTRSPSQHSHHHSLKYSSFILVDVSCLCTINRGLTTILWMSHVSAPLTEVSLQSCGCLMSLHH